MKVLCKNCGKEIIFKYRLFRYNGSFRCKYCGRKYTIDDTNFNIHERAMKSIPFCLAGGAIGVGMTGKIFTSWIEIIVILIILSLINDYIQYKFFVKCIEKYGLKD